MGPSNSHGANPADAQKCPTRRDRGLLFNVVGS